MSVVRYKNQNNPQLPTKALIYKLRKAGRSPLLLGRRLQIDRKGRREVGLEFYYPDPSMDNIENLFNYGQSGSGKTWGMMNLIGQSYFFENRCWVILDSKGSITYDTLVYVRINGVEQVLPIGEIIDRYIPDSPNTHDALDINDDLYVISLGTDYKLQWKQVRQVSKHRPTDSLLKFTTRSGREVISTKNHSFVILQDGEYKSIRGDKLKIGDYIPVANDIQVGGIEKINVMKYFDSEKIVDFDQLKVALEQLEGNTSTTMVVYNDSGIESLSYSAFCRYNWGERDIYPHHFKINTKNNERCNPFPKELNLTEDFGFFCGIFIAEGRAENIKNERRVNITNTTLEIRERITSWLDNHNISYSFDGKKNIRIYSYILARLFTEWFGNGVVTTSVTKRLHPIIFNANLTFLKGLTK